MSDTTPFFTPPMLTFFMALGAHLVAFIWWAAKMASAVTDLGKRIGEVEDKQTVQDGSINTMQVTMARLDERTDAIVKGQERIERQLDKIGAQK